MLPFAPVPSNDLFREVRITSVKQETEDAFTFGLEPEGPPLSWKAGQFLTFVVPTPAGLVRRSYSLSSAPGEPPAITVKRIPNGLISRPLIESAVVGDRLTLAGEPAGFFTLPESPDDIDQVLLFAAGSGITPVFAIVKHLLRSDSRIPMVLAYSNTSPASAIFRTELEALAARHPDRLRVVWYFSTSQDLLRARLSKTTLDLFLKEHAPSNPGRTLAFLCGPMDYMRMAAIVLQARGIPAARIKREVFTPDSPGMTEQPPDVKPHTVTLRRGKSTTVFVSHYPDTVLTAARKHGIELPYSCESGRCGSCIAACTRGKVWMGYNEVLTDAEVDSGRILVCQSYPVGGDVTIEYL